MIHQGTRLQGYKGVTQNIQNVLILVILLPSKFPHNFLKYVNNKETIERRIKMKKQKRLIFLFMTILSVTIIFCGCGMNNNNATNSSGTQSENDKVNL